MAHIPTELVDTVRARVDEGNACKRAVAELLAINAQLLILERRGARAAGGGRHTEGRAVSAPGTQGAAGAAAPPPCETPALRQIAESAQALFHEGKTDETWEFFLAALEAVLVQNRDLTLLVAKLRRAARGTTS